MSKQHDDKIGVAKLKLFLNSKADFAFFGHLVSHLIVREEPGIGTMATDGKHLFYEPAFVESLPTEQLQAVIVHEVLHVVGKHHARRNGRDGDGWNVAADYAINPVVRDAGLNLPDDCLWPSEHGLDEGQSAEWYYDRLPPPQQGGGHGDGEPQPSSCGQVLDAPAQGEAASEGTMPDWDTAVAQAAAWAKDRGEMSQGVARLVGNVLAPATPWQDVLADFVTKLTKNDFCWARPNRRFIGMGIYLPSLHSVELGEIVLCVDCSGSIDAPTLDNFAGHLQGILSAAPCKLHVLFHDVAIGRVDEWLPSDGDLQLRPIGGGGTSHRDCFAWINEHATDAVAAIFLTDLYSDVESLEPLALPTIWASTSEKVSPFGVTIRI